MQGMILAAGYGTRLKPLTDEIPKALVRLKGKPLIQHIIEKFIFYGIDEIVINAHYFAGKIEEFILSGSFSADIKVIKEDNILGTGGGIFNMLPHCTDDNIIVYNTDVICDIDLTELMKYHLNHSPLATMVMQDRETYNQVIIDSKNRFCGLNYVKKGEKTVVLEPAEPSSVLAFCGIHALNKRIAEFERPEKFYSIIRTYLDAVKAGEKIVAYRPDIRWIDVGTTEKLSEAENSEIHHNYPVL